MEAVVDGLDVDADGLVVDYEDLVAGLEAVVQGQVLEFGCAGDGAISQ